jgi:8-amino-7-oxononanoate synthase
MNSENSYLAYGNQRRNATRFRTLMPDRAENVKASPLPSFAANDYLGLSAHPDLIAAAHEAGRLYGVGATGSRLLSGNRDIFKKLEDQIAVDKRTEAALIFNSGYQANVSVLASLLDKATLGQQAIVLFDKWNHSSLYQGVFLSGAHLIRYRHADADHLQELLAVYRNDPRPKFIVTETLFGMDGDIAPLTRLASLAKEHQAFLYLDDAHGTGVFGDHGYGLSTTLDLTGIPHLIMGTFSKALGGSGAFVACASVTRDYLVNHSSGFVYSTAPSPMVIGAAAAAWKMLPALEKERAALLEAAHHVRQDLAASGLNTGLSTTHILPLILGDEATTLAAQETLSQHGIRVSAIRPPTVPQGACRLRMALTAQHSATDIDVLLKEIRRLGVSCVKLPSPTRGGKA